MNLKQTFCGLTGHRWTSKTEQNGVNIEYEQDLLLQFWEHCALYCKRCGYEDPRSQELVDRRFDELMNDAFADITIIDEVTDAKH